MESDEIQTIVTISQACNKTAKQKSCPLCLSVLTREAMLLRGVQFAQQPALNVKKSNISQAGKKKRVSSVTGIVYMHANVNCYRFG